MKLRLFPRQEDAYFGLFEAAADNVVVAAKALLDLPGDPADAETKAKHLLDLEHEGDRITREVLTGLATTFIAHRRFDRDEIYALANGLDDVTDVIEDVADLVFLHGISQPLQGVVEQTKVLVRAAEQTLGVRFWGDEGAVRRARRHRCRPPPTRRCRGQWRMRRGAHQACFAGGRTLRVLRVTKLGSPN